MSDLTPFTLMIRDFRAINKLDWTPSGVCLLTGPNGSGKTTILTALEFLRGLFRNGHETALSSIGGSAYLRRLGTSEDTPVHFEIRIGDIRWTIDLPVDARGLISYYGETLMHGKKVILRAAMYQNEWYYGKTKKTFDDIRCRAKWLWDHAEPSWMRPLVDALDGIRVYDSQWLSAAREPGGIGARESFLQPTGKNLWSVLRAWKSSPRRHNDQFAWVMEGMRNAFPEVIGDMEFEGQAPHGLIFPPNSKNSEDGLPALLAADGVLIGLLQLTAVAGARQGSLLAFDEMENHLHPYAIRSILQSMRKMAEQRDLTIVLTTHSPVLMNAFEEAESQVYAIEPGQTMQQPVNLGEKHDAAWFTAFSLGRRYERGDFAAQAKPRRG